MVKQNTQEQNKPKCPDCGSGYGYMKQGKVWVCRQCGEVSQLNSKDSKK